MIKTWLGCCCLMREMDRAVIRGHIYKRKCCLLKALDPEVGLFCFVLPNAKSGRCLSNLTYASRPHPTH